jgi:hypothetical protein
LILPIFNVLYMRLKINTMEIRERGLGWMDGRPEKAAQYGKVGTSLTL